MSPIGPIRSSYRTLPSPELPFRPGSPSGFPSPSRLPENDLADRWIDIHRDHETVTASEPGIGFPIGFDPFHDRPIDIVVPGAPAYSDVVNLPKSDAEVQIDAKRLKVPTLLFAQQLPLQRGKLRHVYLGDFDVPSRSVVCDKPRQKKSDQREALPHLGSPYKESPRQRRAF